MRFSNSLMAGIAGTLVAGIVSAVSLIGTSDVNRDASVSATGSASLGGDLPEFEAGVQAGASIGANVKSAAKPKPSGSTAPSGTTAGGSVNVTGGQAPGVDVTASVPGTGSTPAATGTVTVKIPKLPLPTGGSTGGGTGGTGGGGTTTVTIPDIAGLPALLEGLSPDILNQVLPLLTSLSPDILSSVVGLLGAVDPAGIGGITGLLGNLNPANLTQFTNVLGLLSGEELPIVGGVLSSLGGLGGNPTAMLGQLLSGLPTSAVTNLLGVASLNGAQLGLLDNVLEVGGITGGDLLKLDGILGSTTGILSPILAILSPVLNTVLGLLNSLTPGLLNPVNGLMGSSLLSTPQELLMGNLLGQLNLTQTLALGDLIGVADLGLVKNLLNTGSLLNDLPALGGLFSVSGGATTPAGSVFGALDADGSGALAGLLQVVPLGSLGQVSSLLNLLSV